MAKPNEDASEKPNSGHRYPRIKVVVRGEGTKDYAFPDVDELVRRGIKRVQKEGLKLRLRKDTVGDEPAEDSSLFPFKFKPLRFLGWLLPSRWRSTAVQPNGGQALISGAAGLQGLMVRRQFDAIAEERFGQLFGAVRWAKVNMGKKYLASVTSLERQLNQLRSTYVQAIPRLLTELGARNPGVSVIVILENAVTALDKELAEILFVLRVYTDCFTQHRDGIYDRQLRAINFLFEQAFLLFQTGDPVGATKATTRIATSAFNIGDVFVSRFTGLPLGTIPGSKGPIGAHALQVPFDLLDILTIQFPLLAHEFRHNLFADIKGLEEEMTAAVSDALVRAHQLGQLKLSDDAVEVYHNQMRTIDVLVKIIADCMGEIDADIAGGVLLSGPAYLYNMLLSFPAMVQGPIGRSKQLLRSSSTYQLGSKRSGRLTLAFAPHPPDYLRAYFVAAALDEIGFANQADAGRKLADFAVAKVPEAIVWHDENERHEAIRVLSSDLKAIAPVVARTLIRTPLKSLGGMSMGDLVMWTQARQAKVDALVEKLLAGSTTVPEGGDFYATYVGSAATMAYWRMVSGLPRTDAEKVASQINNCALAMLEELQKRYEKQ